MFVGWLLSVPTTRYSVSQGRICSDNFTCCHTEIEVANQTFYLTQSQYRDTGPTSPSADPIKLGAWQGSHWSANFLSHWYDSTPKKSRRKRDSNPGSSALQANALPLGQRGGQWLWRESYINILLNVNIVHACIVDFFSWTHFTSHCGFHVMRLTHVGDTGTSIASSYASENFF